MSEEKLYAVRNDEGLLLSYSEQGAPLWRVWGEMLADKPTAEITARAENGHVVTLIEEPEKVVVSSDEAEMLKEAVKDDNFGAGFISDYVDEHWDDYGSLNRTHIQDRLMRAYVNGWTVEKPKLFLVKVPHTDDSYFYKIDDEYCNAGDSYHLEGMTDNKWFTLAEIDHYELTDCERVKVNDDDE